LRRPIAPWFAGRALNSGKRRESLRNTGRRQMLEQMIVSRLDALAKPQGSLGQLERLAARLALTQGNVTPSTTPRRLLVFAGDHGVVAEGVGIWPSAVTTAMIELVAAGRAACSALARSTGTELQLIDVGSLAPEHRAGGTTIDRRIARGSGNLAQGPALTVAQFEHALAVGRNAARAAAEDGCRVVAVGELGIGNTTPATCLIAALTGTDPGPLVGPGAGATEATLLKKREVITQAVDRARATLPSDPISSMAAIGGHEIAALAGAIAGAAERGLTVVLDGVVTAAAALIAQRLTPSALDTSIAAHVSAEPAHRVALQHLGLEPMLDWRLRLGEGTGALLLMPLLDAAAALLTDVATLAEVTGAHS
jgi:nicotinate-nucleotide--dimethylbenzimidazole phosphoribosyltransferase